jgi:hypothetical protein
MNLSAREVDPGDLLAWRGRYRLEMGCQIIHDAIHRRPGWTKEYLLCAGAAGVGYGSVAVGGPWVEEPAAYEFYLLPQYRLHAFELFQVFLEAGGAAMIEVQSNDVLSTVMLHAFTGGASSESILFQDAQPTDHRPPGAAFRNPTATEAPDVPRESLRWHGVVEVEGRVVATGGVLFHYNPP